MNNGKVDWKGNFVALVTPFTKEGDVDEKKFIENIELLLSEGVHGVIVSGCTGESWSLESSEKERLYRIAVDTVKGRATVIAGTGGIVTRSVVALSKGAKEAGVDGVLILPPYYAMINEKEVIAHYRAISDEARVPILLYNIPRRTGVNLTPVLCEELAELDYVVAIKESSNDFVQVEATLAALGDRMLVFTGHSAERGVAAVLLGCQGYVSSMESQVMGRGAIPLYELAASGKVDEARKMQMRTLQLDQAMHKVGTFPANLKAAMNILGRPGGYARAPILELNEAEVEVVRSILNGLDLLATAA
jgi:4-hydroxy-tetrahydrodipicolinate synthase